MNSVTISGFITSEVSVLHTTSGKPFCKFTIQANNTIYVCYVMEKKAYKFAYDVENGTTLTIDCIINDHMQLNITSYLITDQPIRSGQIRDFKGDLLPHVHYPLDPF